MPSVLDIITNMPTRARHNKLCNILGCREKNLKIEYSRKEHTSSQNWKYTNATRICSTTDSIWGYKTSKQSIIGETICKILGNQRMKGDNPTNNKLYNKLDCMED